MGCLSTVKAFYISHFVLLDNEESFIRSIGLFHAAAMTTRERGQVRTNSSKMASNEMETPALDDNKNLNNAQTPSPSVWSCQNVYIKFPTFLLVGWKNSVRKRLIYPRKFSPKAGAFSSVDTMSGNISRLWLQINTV